MDVQEVKACLRALLSSTAYAYSVNNLLSDFESMTGVNLPLFGCSHPVEFLKTLDDTLQLCGDSYDSEVVLIESKKSAHITSLVDRQKGNSVKGKKSHKSKTKRVILPSKNETVAVADLKQNQIQCSNSPSLIEKEGTKNWQPSFKLENSNNQPRVTSHPPLSNYNQHIEFPVEDNVISKKNEKFSHEKSVQVEKSPEIEKIDDYFITGVSGIQRFSSTESSLSSSSQTSSYCSSVNEGIKNKLRKIIKRYPEGLWCCELPELFLTEFHFVLDYREFGYTSLIRMVSELPDVFRCIRPGNEDWILFDASTPPSAKEKKILVLQSTAKMNHRVKANLQKLLYVHLKNSTDSGIEIVKIPDLYKEMFGCPLDVQSLGFNDVKSLLESWEGNSFYMLKMSGNIFVVPAAKVPGFMPIRWEEAVPPVTAENDLFVDIFPKEIVGPEESLPELDLYCHVAVGHTVEVCVAEVWSPSKFFLQLNKFKNCLNRLMDELQRFYNVHMNKYKMPDSTLRPNQVCVGLYSSEPEFPEEWHRAQVIKVINEKTVLVNLVDFGTVTRVKKSQLRFLHQSFQRFPIQAFLAELSGVVPPNDEKLWPMSTNRKFLDYLKLPHFKAEIVEIDFKKPALSVILLDPFKEPVRNINKKLIEEKLAWKEESVTDNLFLLPKSEGENLNNSKPVEKETKSLGFDKSTASQESENAKKAAENLDLTYEFKDVLDLEKNKEVEEVGGVKGHTQNGVLEDKKNHSKSDSFSLEEQKHFGPLSSMKILDIQSPPLSTTSLEPPFKQEPKKPKTLPPGLEHVNIFSAFNQTLLLMHTENRKKRINQLAMELLAKNATVQKVGMRDPLLALKIATEMAETVVTSELASQFPQDLTPLFASSLLAPPTSFSPPNLNPDLAKRGKPTHCGIDIQGFM